MHGQLEHVHAGGWPATLRQLASSLRFTTSGLQPAEQQGAILGWQYNTTVPTCRWTGVLCEADQLVGLDMSGFGVQGETLAGQGLAQ